MDTKLIDKVKKLLALGKRGGTEAEMDAAMRKVHELVATHNLSLTDIESSATTEDALALKLYLHLGPRQHWKILMLDGIAKLYFSQAFRGENGRAVLLARPSNAAIIHHIFLYCVAQCERRAKLFRPGTPRASFKAGFGHRVSKRCLEEAVAAATNQMWDSTTGKHLILAPLYSKAVADMNKFFQDQDRFHRKGEHKIKQNVGDDNAFLSGVAAANSVSLRPNGIEDRKAESVKLLPERR